MRAIFVSPMFDCGSGDIDIDFSELTTLCNDSSGELLSLEHSLLLILIVADVFISVAFASKVNEMTNLWC